MGAGLPRPDSYQNPLHFNKEFDRKWALGSPGQIPIKIHYILMRNLIKTENFKTIDFASA